MRVLEGKMPLPRGRGARRRGCVAVVAVALLCLTAPAAALGRAYTPPKKKVFHGLRDTGLMEDWAQFTKAIRAHSAVMQTFHTWGTRPTMAMERWTAARARGMLSVSTATGGEPEVIDVYQIAHGKGDNYPLWLNHDIAAWGHPTYIRLMAEMNGHWNPYCAFNSDGSSRGSHHSTHWFRQAWRRFELIVKGGSTATINRKLDRLGMPPIQATGPYTVGPIEAPNQTPYSGTGFPAYLPRAPVSLMWVPQTEGSPNLSSNGPGDYFPGRRYVDWVGLDMYSIYSNFDGFNWFYRKYRRKPFVVGEYGLWGEDNPGYVKRMFGWARRHSRTRLLAYYTDVTDPNPFQIWHHPQSEAMLRRILNHGRYPEFAPEARNYGPPPSGGTPAG
jgi:hypothetical protein